MTPTSQIFDIVRLYTFFKKTNSTFTVAYWTVVTNLTNLYKIKKKLIMCDIISWYHNEPKFILFKFSLYFSGDKCT